MALPIPPDDEVQLLLTAVWEHLRAGEHWPTYRAVDRILDRQHGLDIDEVRRRTPESLLLGGKPQGGADVHPDDQLRLTIAGVAACADTEEVVRLFMDAVRFAAEREANHGDDGSEPSMVASDVIPGASDGHRHAEDRVWHRARQLGLLLTAEPWAGGGSLYAGGWSLVITRHIRRFRDVRTIDDYWETREKLRPSPVLDRPALASDPMAPKEVAMQPSADGPIFVVHGRDDHRKYEVARLLERTTDRDVKILHEQANGGATVLEKLERHVQAAGYAVVLLTADDEGRLRGQGDIPLSPRGRQNVIFELGVFIGALGRDRVAVLLEPGVEQPSDLHGLVYIPLDTGEWRVRLLKELKGAEVAVDFDQIP